MRLVPETLSAKPVCRLLIHDNTAQRFHVASAGDASFIQIEMVAVVAAPTISHSSAR